MNRLEWILGIVLVILLAVVAIFSLLLWFQPEATTDDAGPSNSATIVAARANQIAPTSPFKGTTAQIAYASAQQKVAVWRADAQLVNATATWPQGSQADDLLRGETTWSFTFYSPEAKETALVSVIEDTVNVLSTNTYKQETPLLLITSGWDLDSRDVIQQFLSAGGTDFINHNGVTTMTMMLSADPKNGRIEWLISLFGDQTLNSLTMRIDATSGEVLENDALNESLNQGQSPQTVTRLSTLEVNIDNETAAKKHLS